MRLISKIALKFGSTTTGEKLSFDPGSVTVIVGPNHSGKSKMLFEIREDVPSSNAKVNRVILSEVSYNDFNDDVHGKLDAWFRGYYVGPVEDRPNHVLLRMSGSDHVVPKHEYDGMFASMRTLQYLRKLARKYGYDKTCELVKFLGGAERLGLLGDVAKDNLIGPQTTIHGVLFKSDEKRELLQRVVFEAFGWHLAVDPTKLNFRMVCSKTPIPKNLERSLSDEALNLYLNCTELMSASDGVKAFCGLLASAVASDAILTLIDEPEAFLHPALAEKLAVELCGIVKARGNQLIVSTHSSSFLMGCVKAGMDLNILRLSYKNEVPSARLLPRSEIVPLMRVPILRSLNVLNGIFYGNVVVSESESDRAFYDEVNHRSVQARFEHAINDCLFMCGHSWQTIAKIIAPLRRIGVAAAAIVDFDVLATTDNVGFQSLLEASGVPVATRTAIGQLRGIFTGLSRVEKEYLKAGGLSATSEALREDAINLIDHLESYGIFVVPGGELESWLPNLPRRQSGGKKEWLVNTFEAMGEDVSALEYIAPADYDAWRFLGKIKTWLQNSERKGMISR